MENDQPTQVDEEAIALEIGRAVLIAQRTASAIILNAQQQAAAIVSDGGRPPGGDHASIPAHPTDLSLLAARVDEIDRALEARQDRMLRLLDEYEAAWSAPIDFRVDEDVDSRTNAEDSDDPAAAEHLTGSSPEPRPALRYAPVEIAVPGTGLEEESATTTDAAGPAAAGPSQGDTDVSLVADPPLEGAVAGASVPDTTDYPLLPAGDEEASALPAEVSDEAIGHQSPRVDSITGTDFGETDHTVSTRWWHNAWVANGLAVLVSVVVLTIAVLLVDSL